MSLSEELVEKLPLLPLLVYMIDLYDPYGKSHSERVARLSVRLAKKYGYESLMEIELSALLHDIGKIGIPESIRRLPGKYTESEHILMQQHSVLGERLLRMIENGRVQEIILINVRHHHENWSGTGYPDNLRGEAIPLGSRIIRICDYYDALTNVRGYGNSRSHRRALEEMQEEDERLHLFDPALFQLFMGKNFWRKEE
jgi:HD-GYP domain-containing protein (c-di-GMP phosphodiesterase class II)